VIKPLVIFKDADVQQQWFPDNNKILDLLHDWKFTTSENGWTSNAISLEWLRTVFIPQTRLKNSNRWRLLIVDGHGSYISDDFMWHCFSNKIYMPFLPAHASHVLQFLDLSIFSPLKSAYQKLIDDYNLTTDSAPIHKWQFLECYALAQKEAIIERNIRAGWKVTGLWPVNLQMPLKNSLSLDILAGRTRKKQTPSLTSS
jgi:DDE superfamily endonuclease